VTQPGPYILIPSDRRHPAPYGYQPERSTHPNPIKASMGATRARLVPDPETGPWVTRIYEWRVYEKLSRPAIARRLDRAGAPSPDGKGWGPSAVAHILKNPKYTGRVVLGRTRNTGTSQRKGERKVRDVPRAYWTWADEANRHPELVSMDLWEKAQTIGAERGNVRDTEHQTPASANRTLYPLRARIRCNQCKRRMNGLTRPDRAGAKTYIYYLCPHRPSNPATPRPTPSTPVFPSARRSSQPPSPSSWTPTCSATTAPPCSRSSSRLVPPSKPNDATGRPKRSARNSPGSRPRRKDS
jgi:hypothetical protein